MADAVNVLSSQNVVGEGPLWNEDEGALYWVDINGKTINRLYTSSGRHDVFHVDVQVSVVAFRESGGLIAAASNGFSFWDPKTNRLEFIADPEEDKPEARFNDGKVDRRGRFWAGTMTFEGATSSLYCIGADKVVHKMETGITISNGLGWSPDNKIMYFADSLKYVIYAYDFDIETGAIANRRDYVKVTEDYGIPDGLTVDSEGYVWCAYYAGWKVTRFDPSGNIDMEIHVPVSQPTSCIFGGANYDKLYVTSANNGLDAAAMKEQPQAGDLFVIDTGIKGLPEPKFVG